MNDAGDEFRLLRTAAQDGFYLNENCFSLTWLDVIVETQCCRCARCHSVFPARGRLRPRLTWPVVAASPTRVRSRQRLRGRKTAERPPWSSQCAPHHAGVLRPCQAT